jgi:hypothetical protein
MPDIWGFKKLFDSLSRYPGHSVKIIMVKKQEVPKRLTKEQMRKLLLSAKKKAEQMPEEQGSFRLEVICKKSDIDKK